MNPDIWVTRYEAADRLSRSTQTVIRWISKYKPEQQGRGRYATYLLADLLRIKQQSEANRASGLFSADRQPESSGRPKAALAYFDY